MRSYRNVNNSLHYIHLFPNKSSIKDLIYSIFYETFYHLLLFWMLCHYRNKKRKYILCQNGPIDNVDISKIRHLLFSIFINLNKRNSYLVIRNWCNVNWLRNKTSIRHFAGHLTKISSQWMLLQFICRIPALIS